jgi:hypothetical protein
VVFFEVERGKVIGMKRIILENNFLFQYFFQEVLKEFENFLLKSREPNSLHRKTTSEFDC